MKKKTKKRIKKIIIAVVVIIIIVIAAVIIKKKLDANNTSTAVKKQNTVMVTKMDLTNSISATGTLESAESKTVSVSLQDIEVQDVLVSVGDTVKKGDSLVTFDESDLEEALSDAKSDYSDTVTSTNKEISKANDSVADAKESLSDTKTKQAKNVAKAKANVTSAQETVDELKTKLKAAKDEKTKEEINNQLTEAKTKLSEAKDSYDNAVDEQESQIKQAESSVEQAEDSLDSAKTNQTKSLKEANEKVEEAQDNLDNCAVVAPISGTITSLGVEAGDTYSGGTICVIDDVSSFNITTSVDEYDINSVEVGQRVVILTDATDEDELEGEITFVAVSTDSTSEVSSSSGSQGMSGSSSSSSSDGYEVDIKLDSTDSRLRMGMTAKCSIILEESDDCLAVPYDAVHDNPDGTSYIEVVDTSAMSNMTSADADRSSDKKVNSSVTEMATKQITVTKGLESSYYVEISGDGVSEGMMVVIPSDETEEASDSEDTTESTDMFDFGGMGGGSDMGGQGGSMPGGGSGGGPGGNSGSGGNGGGMTPPGNN